MIRIGHGYDAHRLVPERRLILGGCLIPYECGLAGHSDADVLVHAIIDAIFGAAADGDIGSHFPDNDEKYNNISSILLLKEAEKEIRKKYRVVNIDSTVIAQAPKLLKYIPQMRKNIADAIGTDVDMISVKATTEENMGFTGNGEGIAAHAVVLLEKL